MKIQIVEGLVVPLLVIQMYMYMYLSNICMLGGGGRLEMKESWDSKYTVSILHTSL